MSILIFSMILVLSIATIVFLGAYTMIRCESRHKHNFIAMLIAAFLYILGYLLEINALSSDGAFVAIKVMYIGSAFLAPLFLIFVARYCEVKINRIVFIFLMLIPFIIVALVWTTNTHNLFYASYYFDTDSFLPKTRIEGGVLYTSGFIYGLICMVYVIVILAYRYIKTDKKDRRKIKALAFFAAGTSVSAVSQVMVLIDPFDLGLNYIALAIGIFMVLNYVNVMKNDMLDIMPRASEMALNAIRDAYILVDMNKNLLSVNESARVFFPSVRALEKYDPLCRITEFPSELLSFSGNGTHTSVKINMSDEIYYDASVSPVIAEKDNLMGYVILIRDITEINNALESAKQANLSKSKFLATMSHEMRTPMNAIIGISEIALEQEDMPPDTKDSLSRIYSSGYTLLGIINDILDLSKIEAGKFELAPVRYDTASLINDTVRLNSMRIGDKPIQLVIKVAETLPAALFGDEMRIKQILNNILSNAIKYTEHGSVTFKIDSCTDNDAVTLVFTICDTGQGMTKEQLSKLYDEYSMFNRETNRATEGTGLGMSITKSLVGVMGGKISVESRQGSGSTFTVHLVQQISDGGIIGRELAEKLQDFKFTSKMRRARIKREYMPYGSVLIVDDIDASIFVAKRLMRPYGLAIETTSNGYDALDKIRGGAEYDIVFMDHMMPGMDGIETAKQMRETGYTLPIIALTANAIVGQKEIFLENGFDDFISKPIDIRQLDAVLNAHIRDKMPPEVVAEARLQSYGANTPVSSADSVSGVGIAADTAARTDMPECADTLARLRNIDALNVDSALESMSDLSDVYIDTVKLTARLLPKTVDKMDRYMTHDEMSAFTVEVHGLKSVMRNIGAAALGRKAALLERAASKGDKPYCIEQYPPFKSALAELAKHLSAALPGAPADAKMPADMPFLVSAIGNAKDAAKIYDSSRALEIISPHMEYAYTEKTAGLIKEIVFAFESFDCEEALKLIVELEESLDETGE